MICPAEHVLQVEGLFWNGLPMIPETWRLISIVILIFLLLIGCIPLTSMHACFVLPSIPIKDDWEHLHERKFLMCDSVCADSVLNFDSTALGATLFLTAFLKAPHWNFRYGGKRKGNGLMKLLWGGNIDVAGDGSYKYLFVFFKIVT